jgi:hypothetical protein
VPKKQLFLKKDVYALLHWVLYMFIFVLAMEYCSAAFNRPVKYEIGTMALLLACFLLLWKISNFYSLLVGFFWIWWMPIGLANVSAWSILHSGQDLDIERACFIYLVFLVSFLFGIYLLDVKQDPIRIGREWGLHYVWVLLLLLFPVLMFFESIINVGYIPILSGGFVDEMYNISYGKLYSYKAIMIFSILIAFHLYSSSRSEKSTWTYLYLLVFIFFLLSSLFDGKRVVFLASVIAVFSYMYKVYGWVYIKKNIYSYCIFVFIFYVGMSLLRSGDEFEGGKSIHNIFYFLGAEFRDFAWTVTNYTPGEIPNYSWVASSLGSFINGGVLSFLGFDKGGLVFMDSARSWMNVFEIELGIRTGIFSELWFEFGFLGIFFSFLLGLSLSKISTGLYAARNLRGMIFKLFVYAYIFLSIMGQSSLFFGVLITSIYVYLVLLIIEVLLPEKQLLTRKKNKLRMSLSDNEIR